MFEIWTPTSTYIMQYPELVDISNEEEPIAIIKYLYNRSTANEDRY